MELLTPCMSALAHLARVDDAMRHELRALLLPVVP